LSFAGHFDLLSALSAALESAREGVVQILSGLGGVGKTQIAVELAWRRRALYDVVWTVNATSGATVFADLAALARHLALVDETATLEEEAHAARHWLSEHGGWLLLVDDAEDSQSLEG
jgi:hypothetical protein